MTVWVTVDEAMSIFAARGLTVRRKGKEQAPSRPTVVAWCQKGVLKAERKGDGKRGIWLIDPEALATFTPPKNGRPQETNPTPLALAQRASRQRRHAPASPVVNGLTDDRIGVTQKYQRAETREAAPMIPITDVPRDPENPRAEETAAPAFQSVTTQQVVGALRAAKLSMTPRAAKSRIGTTSTPGYSARALPNGTVRVDYERATRSYDLDATTYRAQLDAGLAAAQRALHARTIPSRIVPSGTGGFLVAGTAPTPPILTDEML